MSNPLAPAQHPTQACPGNRDPRHVYDTYAEAQRVVDYLSDEQFPVGNVAIVGSDLKSIERVTGRLTRKTIAVAGAASGFWIGLFVGIAFAIFSTKGQLGFLITTPLLGAAFGVIWSQLGFSTVTQRGARDFASLTQVVATRYEVLVEHRLAEDARNLMAKMPNPPGHGSTIEGSPPLT